MILHHQPWKKDLLDDSVSEENEENNKSMRILKLTTRFRATPLSFSVGETSN